MFYLWKQEDDDNILIDRLKTKQVVLKSQQGGVVLPLLKATNTKLSFIFSEINGRHESHAIRLEWNDTANIIAHVLQDEASLDSYKPSCMMYYTVAITGEEDFNIITLEFDVYYNLWRKLNNDEAKPEFEDIQTETLHFCYTFTAEQYKDILLLINIYSRDTAEKLLDKSLQPDFRRYKMLMESGDLMLAESGDNIIGETILTYDN